MVPKKSVRLKYKHFSIRDTAILLGRCLCCTALFGVLHSCEEDLAVKYKDAKKDFPTQIIYDADMIQRDSGRIKMRAKAPLIEQYTLTDSPYTIVKKGIFIEYYDFKNPGKPGKLKADYARMDEKKQLYYARGNVQIVTAEGQMFAMRSITWNKEKKLFYTRDTVYVNDNKGNLMIGNHGMTAKEDFSAFTFYNSTGELNADAMPDT